MGPMVRRVLRGEKINGKKMCLVASCREESFRGIPLKSAVSR